MRVIVWLYFIIGELTTLLALDDEAAVRVRSLAQKVWWLPYGGALLVIIAWPVAASLLRLLPNKK